MPRRSKRSKKQDTSSKYANYFNPTHPGSFCGVSGYLRNNKNVDKEKFKKWSEEQNAITQHSCARKHFPRRRVLVFSAGELFQIDLMDFQSISASNNGFKFVLVAIDVFSKYAWAVAIKRKTAKEVLRGLQIIVKDTTPKKIQCDRGLEFFNQSIEKWLKLKKIEMYATYNYDMKACVVERFIRTFKSRLYRYFTLKSTETYIHVLQDIIKSYNHSFHRSIKMTPSEGRKSKNESLVYNNLYRSHCKDHRAPAPLKLNDTVRVSRYPSTFLKSYTKTFSTEYFFIDSIERTRPVVYRLRDLTGEKIKGTFYKQELIKITVNPNTPYEIETILAEKGNRVLVKYLGWPSKFNEWLPKKKVKKLI